MLFDLSNAFLNKQKILESTLASTTNVSHPTDKGDIAEENWQKMLRDVLPRRYRVSKATVVDSQGGMSEAIDIVIHDRHFSPLVFEQNGVMYVPAESVYAIFEVKPELNKKYMEYAAGKASSVRKLHRTSAVVVHAGGRITEPKVPPVILAGLLTARPGWAPPLGEPFQKYLTVEGNGRLDLGCIAAAGAWEVPADREISTITVEKDKGLVFLVLRLLARLQAMGTVPAMDYDTWGAVLKPNS